MVSVTAMTIASPSTARPPASPATLTVFPLVSGGLTETGAVVDGSMVMGVDWSGPCTGSVPSCVVVGSSSCCGVVGVVVVIGGGVCVGTCVEVGEGDGVEGVIIIAGCVVDVGQSKVPELYRTHNIIIHYYAVTYLCRC